MSLNKKEWSLLCLTLLLISTLHMDGCAARTGTVTHRVTQAQHSLLSVVGAFQDSESAIYAEGFISAGTHKTIEGIIGKVALACEDLDKALAAGAAAPDIKTKLDAIYAMLDTINAQGISGVKNPKSKAELEIALDGIKAIIDNALTQVQ